MKNLRLHHICSRHMYDYNVLSLFVFSEVTSLIFHLLCVYFSCFLPSSDLLSLSVKTQLETQHNYFSHYCHILFDWQFFKHFLTDFLVFTVLLFYAYWLQLFSLDTVSRTKWCHFIFDYNSRISWSIFAIFVLL